MMVRLLMTAAVFAAHPAAGETTAVTLRQGSSLAVTATADGRQIAFELAGRIWIMPAGGGQARALTDDRYRDARPVFSPDGKRLAFESVRHGYRHIVILDTETAGPARRLTFGDFHHRAPNWSPDGRRLLMASDRGGDFGIWEVDVETLALEQLTFGAGNEHDPAWNADGTRFAFTANDGGTATLFTLSPPGKPRPVVTGPGRMRAASWRPDGRVITYVHRAGGASEIQAAILSDPPVVKAIVSRERVAASPLHWLDRDHFIYAADGAIRQRKFGALEGRDIPFAARITLQRDIWTPARPDYGSARRQPVAGITGITPFGNGALIIGALGDLWELDRDGKLVRQLTNGRAIDTQPALSPDGSRLAFVSDRSAKPEVWIIDLSDGTPRRLTHERGDVAFPAWRPDSGAVAYLAATGPAAGSFAVRQIELPAGEPSTLIETVRQPSALSWSPAEGIELASGAAGRRRLLRAGPARPDTRGSSFPLDRSGLLASPPQRSVSGRLAWLEAGALRMADRNGDTVTLASGAVGYPRWLPGRDVLIFFEAGHVVRFNPLSGKRHAIPVPLTWRAAVASRRTIVHAGRIYDGIAPAYRVQQDIVIEGQRITAIRPWSHTQRRDTDIWIDTGTDTVLPGLIDLGVRQRPTPGAQLGRKWLAFGVTSIREDVMWPHEAAARRETWLRGQSPGPRLFAARTICLPARVPADEARLKTAVEDAMAFQVHAIRPCGMLDGDAEAILTRIAHQRGLPVAGGRPFPGLILGQDEITLAATEDGPAPVLYGDVLETAGTAGVIVRSRLARSGLPGLADRTPILDDRRYRELYPAHARHWYANSRTVGGDITARAARQALFLAAGRGARLAAASGAPDTPPGLGLHAELQLLVAAGLRPFQALQMATLGAARALGAARDLGSIREGRLADLIVVPGDPLQDVSAAADVRLTIVNGRPHTLESLVDPGGALE